MRVTVVLPFPEQCGNLESFAWRIHRALSSYEYQILLADDGPNSQAHRLKKSVSGQIPLQLYGSESGGGPGEALREGLLEACGTADIVVTMDAAGSEDASRIPLLIDAVSCGSDLVIASRFTPKGGVAGLPSRDALTFKVSSRVFRLLTGILGATDYVSGFRAYRGELVEQMCSGLEGGSGLHRGASLAQVELLARAHLLGASIAEIQSASNAEAVADRDRTASRPTLLESLRVVRCVRSRIPSSESSRGSGGGPCGLTRPEFGVVFSLLSDVAAVHASFLLSFVAYRGLIALGVLDRGNPDPLPYELLAALYAATTVLSFWRFGLYKTRLSVLYLRHLEIVVQALTVSSAFFFAVLFFASTWDSSRLLVLVALVFSFPLVTLERRIVTGWLRRRRIRLGQTDRILIYGAGSTGKLLMKKLLQAPRLGAEIVGFLDDGIPDAEVIRIRVSQLGDHLVEARVLGKLEDLASIVHETGATQLCIAIPDIPAGRLEDLRIRAQALGIRLGIVPRLGSMRADQVTVEDIGALPILRLKTLREDAGQIIAKRTMDILGVLLLTPILLPIGILTAIAIRMEGGPVIFRQTRIGKDGKPFTLLKFRTMHSKAAAYATSPADGLDPRVTRVGRYVRLAGLDELPQLINVLRGEMSLVGPRPEMPQVVARYGPIERSRLKVRPGLTGMWQISPDRATAIHENLEYDLYYLSSRNLILDALVLGETLLFALRAMRRSLRNVLQRADAKSARRLLMAGPKWSVRGNLVGEKADSVVFVALDQRRRPDEPRSWQDFVPRVPALVDRFVVKLLAAKPNQARLTELMPAYKTDTNPGSLEYVAYEPDSVRELASQASCVVTDLRHVADWASGAGVTTFMIDGELIRLDSHAKTGDPSIVDFVSSALSGGTNGPSVLA